MWGCLIGPSCLAAGASPGLAALLRAFGEPGLRIEFSRSVNSAFKSNSPGLLAAAVSDSSAFLLRSLMGWSNLAARSERALAEGAATTGGADASGADETAGAGVAGGA